MDETIAVPAESTFIVHFSAAQRIHEMLKAILPVCTTSDFLLNWRRCTDFWKFIMGNVELCVDGHVSITACPLTKLAVTYPQVWSNPVDV